MTPRDMPLTKCEAKPEGGTCRFCWQQIMDDDLDEWTFPCHSCEGEHLRRNMIEKIVGLYCVTCAAKYEQRLMDERKTA